MRELREVREAEGDGRDGKTELPMTMYMNKNGGRKGVMEVKTEESERRDRMVDLPII